MYRCMETSYDSLAVTSKLPSTKTSLSCVFARAAFVILMVCDRNAFIYRCRPYKTAGCFQANHLVQSV
jgi:hypothetical protein